MELRRWLTSKPLTFFTSAMVGCTSVTVSVVMFFMNQRAEITNAQHELRVQEVSQEHMQKYEKVAKDYEDVVRQLNSRLATIERRLGTTSDTFDVTRLLVTPKDAAKWLGHAQYFPDARFYGRRLAATDNWVYEQSTELALMTQMIGADLETTKQSMPPQQVQAFERFPLHTWRGPQVFKFGGDLPIKQLQPLIFVQKVPHSLMPQLFADFTEEAETTEPTDPAHPEEKAPTREETLTTLNGMYRGDAAGLMLSSLLNVEMQFAVSFRGAGHTNLKEIQKAGNVVYAQFETVLKNVEINGQHCAEFYLLRELLLISTADDLYIVKTLVPTGPEFNTDAIAWINGWFGDFGIPDQGVSLGSGLTHRRSETVTQ
jgi:hypothetical protein